ncbi:hypothetical protein [Pseudomonas sp. p21]|uniref:hypothetical protein n=1 Tax=Pseudomonas sp. p21 TaxID=1825979 RepID=UPI0007C816F3|nr:hypothetical protein [Pseudomonas sp. p21]
MFKGIAAIFKGNFQIEKSFSLAQEAFAMNPKALVSQMPTDMAREWRQNFRQMARAMSLNEHECAAMMVIGFVGLISDEAHRANVEHTFYQWYRQSLIRTDIYLHFMKEKDSKPNLI